MNREKEKVNHSAETMCILPTSWVGTRSISIAGTIVSIIVAIAGVHSIISSIHKAHIAEIPVVVFATIAVFTVSRVAATCGTGLHVTVTVGAEDEGFLITKSQTIFTVLSGVLAVVDAGTRDRQQPLGGKCDVNLDFCDC